MKPIVSFDVDMTLLDHKDWKIPNSAMETIEQLREKYTIVLATGRDMDSSFSVYVKDQVRPDAIIHLNGTKVTVGEKLIYEHIFDKNLLKRILEYTKNTPYSVGTTVGEWDYYVNPENVRAHDIDLWGKSGRRFKDPYELLKLDVRTMAYIGDEAGAMAMEETFLELHLHMFADKKGADVVEKKASKAVGLQKLCEYYQVPLSETVAFGDSMNDYDMIKIAGRGVAMGNAMEKLKEAADHVTDPIDQDGIKNACMYLGLIK